LNAIVDHVSENIDPTGPYGAWTLGLNQHSEVMETFRGGRPAIALHGTADLNDIGERVSNGCVRIHNDDLVDLASRVELGTPVIIRA
ncbi:L,D-transpeptidase, partial [Patescibacteria group bacterium]|nr:L,D-transpeptidase [Patescibacteria group bacterium]